MLVHGVFGPAFSPVRTQLCYLISRFYQGAAHPGSCKLMPRPIIRAITGLAIMHEKVLALAVRFLAERPISRNVKFCRVGCVFKFVMQEASEVVCFSC